MKRYINSSAYPLSSKAQHADELLKKLREYEDDTTILDFLVAYIPADMTIEAFEDIADRLAINLEDDVMSNTSVKASWLEPKRNVCWPNGKQLTNDEIVDVLMQFYGEDYKAAREDMETVDDATLQKAVDWYVERIDGRF